MKGVSHAARGEDDARGHVSTREAREMLAHVRLEKC